MALYEYFNNVGIANTATAVDDSSPVTQDFTVTDTHYINSIRIYAQQGLSGCTGRVFATIKDSDSNSLASGSVNVGVWSYGSYGWGSISLSQYAKLDSGSTYSIVISSVGLSGLGPGEAGEQLLMRGYNDGQTNTWFYEEYGNPAYSYPYQRSDFYDEESYFDISTETWVSTAVIAGGGRYNQNLIVVGQDDNGYGVIYYG